MFQEKIIDDLGTEMDSTTNRLDFVQVIPFNGSFVDAKQSYLQSENELFGLLCLHFNLS